ncbi:MAG: NUDIX domain-containing protein [Oscillospiraceae bacterium]|nr:NUDIX domain-containing protein [Oscillospiraceae bacterium]
MIFEYCPKCGEKLGEKEIGDEGLVPFCFTCDNGWFSFSYPCVLCLIVDENDNVILTRERADGFYGGVAGFIKEGETPEDAAKREIREEVGLIVEEVKYMGSYSKNKDTLMLNFICIAKNSKLKISENELYSAEWFKINEAQNLVRPVSITKKLLDNYMQSKNI